MAQQLRLHSTNAAGMSLIPGGDPMCQAVCPKKINNKKVLDFQGKSFLNSWEEYNPWEEMVLTQASLYSD